ncbi:MAG: 3-phosphoshikimate 1-carboxyvinyltransferase [Sphaerochaetaceae bacterium]|jgi:3-phosphoshikimate 1-carboxyvinyltransferase|nr:3-phosphoshikimate 1-carboxyvinyltransferase [Sphaerochaetaceae bacterium]HHU88771.1 3-phosphoshikimate 1-carboxyvinyltransferase [Spirochaetales bacterium]
MDKTLQRRAKSATIKIISSKSHTIRALLIATFATGESTIHNPLESEDTAACIAVCRALGAKIIRSNDSIKVVGIKEFPPKVGVDCQNSGTTLYLATGLAATTDSEVTFIGDTQLNKRPLRELLDALRELGATITAERYGYPPFTIKGPLKKGRASMECHSSQFLSSLLLAAPLAKEATTLEIPLLNERPYVEMTCGWLESQGVTFETSPTMDHFFIKGGESYSPFEATIGGDYSAAAFFFCAAAISGTSIKVEGLQIDDTQGDKELLSILEIMGCSVEWDSRGVTVTGGNLIGGKFDLNAIPDTLPILAVTAAFAQGESLLYNVPQARIKETDRIATMVENLRALGGDVEEGEDFLLIRGKGELKGGSVKGFGDHRIIMALAIASLGTQEPVTIDSIDAVAVTFPTFFTLFDQITEEVGNENL